jgi:hypothetical protein
MPAARWYGEFALQRFNATAAHMKAHCHWSIANAAVFDQWTSTLHSAGGVQRLFVHAVFHTDTFITVDHNGGTPFWFLFWLIENEGHKLWMDTKMVDRGIHAAALIMNAILVPFWVGIGKHFNVKNLNPRINFGQKSMELNYCKIILCPSVDGFKFR